MELNQDDINEGLLLAYLKGEEIPEDESNRVERWLESEINQEEARRIYQSWELSLLASPDEGDTEMALENVRSRLGWETSIRTLPASGSYKWWWVAASLVILSIAFVSIQYFQKEEPKVLQALDQVKEYRLEDETVVSLKEGGELSYQPADLLKAGDLRKVMLTGEAFFEVAHDPDKPFVITTYDAEVKVLGTKFLVQAFDHQPTKVLVTEGKVQVTYLATNDVVVVEAEEEVVAAKDKPPVVKASDDNQLYWKTGVMTFQDDSLDKVFKTLSQEFETEITVRNKAILSCKITATFKRKSLETIVKVIETTHNLHSTREGDVVIFDGDGCQ